MSRGRAAVHWRRDPAILARLPAVERRHLAGATNVAIAAELGVDETTVRRDLLRIQELWLQKAGDEISRLRARAVAELDEAKRQALAAAEWDLRCERAILFGIDEQGAPLAVERDDKGSARFSGNKAGALQAARQAVMDAAKLLGLLVDKQEHTASVMLVHPVTDRDALRAAEDAYLAARGRQQDALGQETEEGDAAEADRTA